MTCETCPAGKAVILESHYDAGENYYLEAGRKYIADRFACASCPDEDMIFDDSGEKPQCNCDDTALDNILAGVEVSATGYE